MRATVFIGDPGGARGGDAGREGWGEAEAADAGTGLQDAPVRREPLGRAGRTQDGRRARCAGLGLRGDPAAETRRQHPCLAGRSSAGSAVGSAVAAAFGGPGGSAASPATFGGPAEAASAAPLAASAGDELTTIDERTTPPSSKTAVARRDMHRSTTRDARSVVKKIEAPARARVASRARLGLEG